MTDRYVKFVGIYRNKDAAYGEDRHGEETLEIDLETHILTVNINGWNERSYQLKPIK